jgi:hypothetical protein
MQLNQSTMILLQRITAEDIPIECIVIHLTHPPRTLRMRTSNWSGTTARAQTKFSDIGRAVWEKKFPRVCTNVLDTLSCAWVPKWQQPFMCVLHTYNLPTQECYSKSNMWDNKHMTWQYSNTQKFTLFFLKRVWSKDNPVGTCQRAQEHVHTFENIHQCAHVCTCGHRRISQKTTG